MNRVLEILKSGIGHLKSAIAKPAGTERRRR
jgi:hypothetical protein